MQYRPFHLYFAAAAGAFSRGVFTVTTAWTALTLTNDIASVGRVLMIWSVLALFIGPFVGVFVDRHDRRLCVLTGQGVCTIALALPLLPFGLSYSLIVAVSLIWAIGQLLIVGPFDALLQGSVAPGLRRQIGARMGSARQIAMVGGGGLAGFIVHYFGAIGGYFIAASSAALMWAAVFALRSVTIEKRGVTVSGYVAHLKEGLDYLANYPALLGTAAIGALAFSAGQMTNALLPAFIRNDIGAGSDLYGVADAAWSAGAVTGSALVIYLLKTRKLALLDGQSLLALGILMGSLFFIKLPMPVIAIQVLAGGAANIAKAISDGNILHRCAEDKIGRVRSLVQALTGLMGVVIYLSPSVLRNYSAGQIYLVWGIVLAIVGAGLSLAIIRSKQSHAQPEER
ncbi:MFS transporter [Rhizobium leguminosarum]|uniref:MFS transporter n=1 Tax=Rhizobium leguminosarum TaxID=384 RepID=A0A7K3VQ39_RHILE|nr:MFS transporter [Rhizobium leguminosarum]NEK18994.1 MFS transporter [Rhizobium leguminosarum]